MRNFAVGFVVGALVISAAAWTSRSWAIDFWVGKEPPTYRITVGTSMWLRPQSEDVVIDCVAEPTTIGTRGRKPGG